MFYLSILLLTIRRIQEIVTVKIIITTMSWTRQSFPNDVLADIAEGLAVLLDKPILSWPSSYCFHLFAISKTLLVLEVVNGQGQDLSRLQLQLARSDQVQINGRS